MATIRSGKCIQWLIFDLTKRRWCTPPSSPTRLHFPVRVAEKKKLNENTQSSYHWKAGVMHITPITLDCTQSFYGMRNQSWKIQVHKLKFIKT